MKSKSSGINLKQRKKRVRRKQMMARFTLFVIIIIAVLCLIYVCISLRYQRCFLPRTHINGINVGGKSVKEADRILSESASDYSLTIQFRENASETITGQSIQYTISPEEPIRTIQKKQHALAWFLRIWKARNYDVDLNAEYSDTDFEAAMEQLSELQPEQMTEPVDAEIVYEDGSFQIVPESDGTTLDPAAAVSLIRSALDAGDTTLDLTASDIYESAGVYSDNEELTSAVKKLNHWFETSITYELPNNQVQVLDADTMIQWLSQDEDGSYVLNDSSWDSHISTYVEELAKSYDTVYRTHPFKTTSGTEVSLPSDGYYGWKIDVTEETAQLKDDIEKGTSTKREPVYKKREASSYDDNYGFGDSYVEIDLTHQHMWIYKNGEMKFDTEIVSGTNNDKFRTSAGAFAAYDKQRDKVLQGDRQEDGTFGYANPVKYWIRVTEDGVGIHDAPWREDWSSSAWLTGGSRGCINVPPANAETVYNLVDEGTPIAIYYLE